MMVLITEDGKRVIIVSRDVLSTSEGLGNVPRDVTGGGRWAWAPFEPEHRLASVWFKKPDVSLSAETSVTVSPRLCAFWIAVTAAPLS